MGVAEELFITAVDDDLKCPVRTMFDPPVCCMFRTDRAANAPNAFFGTQTLSATLFHTTGVSRRAAGSSVGLPGRPRCL